ncbi:hypothetical protein MIT9_P0696 [Methylomarinovum caldicuralii]|uniref:Uncharacterized protein n=1 Tax=Methylomarinovum caldicuralii TaxID=438856 RepID=A0AAU9C0N6_9GAMM|nr:hypothetical protein [Methylomarinovum caldicuralii]BCX81118.1 hypothetical protein MIT9_P0696 [Methylomarinovum caldicuralii]
MKKTMKTVLTAAIIAVSGGVITAYPTAPLAAETAEGVTAAVAAVKANLEEALKLAQEGTDPRAVLDALGAVKQAAKEITGDQFGMPVQRLMTNVRRARGMARRGDLAGAEEQIKQALEQVKNFPVSGR